MMFSDIVILAGGIGERLWPASLKDEPKQFLTIDGSLSFFQQSLLRSLSLGIEGHIVIITRKGLEHRIAEQCKSLSKQELNEKVIIIAEPEPKHTAAPILLACHLLNKLFPKDNHSLLVLPSDHIIEPLSVFKNDVEKAFASSQEGHLLTFGIQPFGPSTGYGYILTGEPDTAISQVYKVNKFAEKPDHKTAEKYIAAGNCRWNSGIYAFKSSFFITEIQKCTPEISDAFTSLEKSTGPKIVSDIHGLSFVQEWPEMTDAYMACPSISVDKALAEKTSEAYTVLATFSWDDVGTWDSFEKHCSEKNSNSVLINSDDCFVYSDIPVAICGLDGISVVIKNGKALIMKKGCSSLVKDASNHFSEK